MAWKCPTCKREFAKEGQQHSCTIYPIGLHFKNKEAAKALYEILLKKMETKVGKINVESLPCCIHWVSTYTFAGIFAMKDKLRIHFSLKRRMKSGRISRKTQIAASRFLYSMDVRDKKEIDSELLGWLVESYK